MADRRCCGAGERGARLLVLLAILAAVLTGCGVPDTAEADELGIQRMLDRRAAALLAGDADGFLEAVAPGATGYRERQRRMLEHLADVPLAEWRYRLKRTGGFEPAAGEGRRIAAEVEFGYRLTGHDSAPVRSVHRLTLLERDRRWYVAAETSGEDGGGPAARPLWEQGRVDVVRGRRSLVLGVGHDARWLRALARTADRAVPAVDAAWRGKWDRHVVVLAPRSLEGVGDLLGGPSAAYRGIAAVTTGETGDSAAPADRVVVNPEAYDLLGEDGRQVVLTHETTHVATRAHTSDATPLWLSEGFADWAGYRGTDRTPRQAAPELAREVAAGRLPQRLPDDAEFGFGGEGRRLARAYEGGWLACRMIADQWGEERLLDLYRKVGAGSGRGTVDRALREVLGLDEAQFTARWRSRLAEELG